MSGDDSVSALTEEIGKLIEGHRATFIIEDLWLVYFMGNLEFNPHLTWDFKKSFQFSLGNQTVLWGAEKLAPLFRVAPREKDA